MIILNCKWRKMLSPMKKIELHNNINFESILLRIKNAYIEESNKKFDNAKLNCLSYRIWLQSQDVQNNFINESKKPSCQIIGVLMSSYLNKDKKEKSKPIFKGRSIKCNNNDIYAFINIKATYESMMVQCITIFKLTSDFFVELAFDQLFQYIDELLQREILW